MTFNAPKWLALSCLIPLAAHAATDLTLISFGGSNKDAQVKAYYGPFQKTSGVHLVTGEYNGEMAKIKAMVEAGNIGWDVVEVETPELIRGCDEGLFEKLDWSQIGNKKDFVPAAVSQCGAGIFVWSTALTYNAAKLKGTPTGWKDFWDLKKFPGKRGLRKGAKYTLEFALLADGVKPADVYKVLATKAGVDRAFKKLDQIKPAIQWWDAGAQPAQFLASGDVVMSSAYNGRIALAQKDGNKNLKIVWGGSIYDVDSWAIVKGSPKKAEALKYIAFASKPQYQKIYSENIAYGPTNVKALPLLSKAVQADLPTAAANIKNAMALNVQFWVDNGEELEQRFNAWAAK
ncbi:ABC transporter substrate-binding protein [Paludibacterium yongneupense]|uniref:ABC transporter substrate-binding protein n=1 Tax=Paludibacterium yongneupense TaxID=400061 RepID=UPI000404E968|nr:ABC transporter substrate-binding protein [Paludibacterium yongneupense]